MNKKNWTKILSASPLILLASVFLFGQTARAAQGQNGRDKPDSKPAAKSQQVPTKPSTAAEEKIAIAEDEAVKAKKPSAEEHSQRGGHQEGVKVHGHWTIEVRNPEGTVATHREFENSVFGTGSAFVNLMARQHSAGGWIVILEGVPGGNNAPCAGACVLQEAIVPVGLVSGSTAADTSTNLGLSYSASALGAYLTLSGTITATQAGELVVVRTNLVLCGPGNSPQGCAVSPPPFPFTLGTVTQTALATPLSVTLGQTIAVTVTISFS